MKRSIGVFGFFLFLLNTAFAQFNLIGSATSSTSACYTTLQITPAATSQTGAAWNTTQLNLSNAFILQGQVYLGNNDGGADGIAFVLQRVSATAMMTGAGGGAMGYCGTDPNSASPGGGLTPSLITEFDTWPNNTDPAYDHLSIQKNGWCNHSVAANQLAGPIQMSSTSGNTEDGIIHKYKITWDPATQVYQVYFDCVLRLTYTGDLINTVFSGNPLVWWGFTGATGGAFNSQWVTCYLTSAYTPVATASPTTCSTSNGSASVSGLANPGCATFAWAPGGASTSGISGITTGTYTVTVTEWFGCPTTLTATVTSNGGGSINAAVIDSQDVSCAAGNDGFAVAGVIGGAGTYTFSWNNGSTNDTISGLSAGTYIVTITDPSGCSGMDTVVIDQPTGITLSAVGTDSPCIPNAAFAVATASGGTGALNYAWNTIPPQLNDTAVNLTAGNYTVGVTDSNGCLSTSNVTVYAPATALDATVATDAPKCLGNTIQVTSAVIGGTSPYTYLWTPSGNTATALLLTPTDTTSIVYHLLVTDQNGCIDTASALVFMHPLPVMTSIHPSDLCVSDAPLGLNFAGPAGGIYSGTGISSGAFDPTIGPGVYPLSYQYTNPTTGCSSSIQDSIRVNALPVFTIYHNPSYVSMANPFVGFSPSDTAGRAWLWSFGDGAGSFYELGHHEYADTGSYTITLLLTDTNGCSNTAYDTLLVLPNYTVFLPNAFSPDGDGKNDIFKAVGTGILSYNMVIFDRWGNAVFETSDLSKGWAGDNASDGVYIYRIRLKDFESAPHEYAGAVSLIR